MCGSNMQALPVVINKSTSLTGFGLALRDSSDKSDKGRGGESFMPMPRP
jgi:hypothetical protein